MICLETIESFYEYFYRKIYKKDYRFTRTKTTQSNVESFIKLISKHYSLEATGKDFLFNYFLFQFKYWDEVSITNTFSDKVVIAWIIGKKAFKRWTDRNTEYDWQFEKSVLLNKYGIKKSDLVNQPKKVVVDDGGAMIRKQFLNTERGFALCVEFTTLYNPDDESCKACKFKEMCKELQRVNYPRIFKQRSQ